MKQSLYIAFEGIEGSGKSTHVKFAEEFLKAKGVSFITTFEPGATPLGKRLREMILHEDMDPFTELLLYIADRKEHIKQIIKPAINKGMWVISDRCFLSTLAYQGYGRGLNIKLIEKLNEVATEGIEPDLIILLDLDVESALKRCRPTDRIERESLEFHEKVRKGYLEEAKKRKNVIIVNSNLHKEEVKKRVMEILTNLTDQY